jgi:hypothetical protein
MYNQSNPIQIQFQQMSERGLTMVVHSVVIGVALYAIMTLLLKQSSAVAENRSILVAACVLIYMIVFGHGLPGSINSQL